MPRARVTQRHHNRRENGKKRRYEVGDTFQASESEMKAFSDRLEAAPEPVAEKPSKPPKPQADEPPRDAREADLRDLGMNELRDLAEQHGIGVPVGMRKVNLAAQLYDAGAGAPVEPPEPRDAHEAALRALPDDDMLALAEQHGIDMPEDGTAASLAAALYDVGAEIPGNTP